MPVQLEHEQKASVHFPVVDRGFPERNEMRLVHGKANPVYDGSRRVKNQPGFHGINSREAERLEVLVTGSWYHESGFCDFQQISFTLMLYDEQSGGSIGGRSYELALLLVDKLARRLPGGYADDRVAIVATGAVDVKSSQVLPVESFEEKVELVCAWAAQAGGRAIFAYPAANHDDRLAEKLRAQGIEPRPATLVGDLEDLWTPPVVEEGEVPAEESMPPDEQASPTPTPSGGGWQRYKIGVVVGGALGPVLLLVGYLAEHVSWEWKGVFLAILCLLGEGARRRGMLGGKARRPDPVPVELAKDPESARQEVSAPSPTDPPAVLPRDGGSPERGSGVRRHDRQWFDNYLLARNPSVPM